MLIFLIKFSILLIVSGIFIVSWFNLSRHYIVINPDNTEKIDGELLRFWSQLWEKVKTYKITYYSGESLGAKFSDLQRLFPNTAAKLIPYNGASLVLIDKEKPLNADELLRIQTSLQCNIEVKEDIYFLYLEDTVYWLPDIIRKPISACPRCMASIFGSAIWLLINRLDSDLFEWTNSPNFGFYSFWLIFMVTLSYLNDFFYKKSFH